MRTAGLILALVFSGCICYTPGHAVGDRPDDWRTGADLASFEGFKSHAGAGNDRIYHNSTNPISAPATCIAYRGDQQFSKDTCIVKPEPASTFDRVYGPWHVQASWAGGDCDADRTRGDTVVAFDSTGRIVAFWAGKLDEGGSFATE